MYIFLFLKQVVDIFYKYIWLDYILAGMALVLFIYQVWMIRPCKDDVAVIKQNISFPDICVVYFAIVSTIKYLAYSSLSVKMYGKLMTAFLIYMLGRIAYKRIDESSRALALSAYMVIYANVAYRLYQYGWNGFFSEPVSQGGLYYFDTDLSYAIILGFIFVAMYAKNGILKFFTIFVTCPFMVFHSGADIQKILMIVLYVILLFYMAERAIKRRKISDYILPIALLILIAVLAGVLMPVFSNSDENILTKLVNRFVTDVNTMQDRYADWRVSLDKYKEAGSVYQIFGIGKAKIYEGNNQYLNTFFQYGIVGIIGLIMVAINIAFKARAVENRKLYYVTVMIAILFLGTSIVINGMERTQMSWFVMMFAGMTISECKRKDSEIVLENDG